MSRANDQGQAPAEHPAKHRPKGDYDVGYCKPPAEHRFKHGNNANPKGRKKGSKNQKLVIQDVLFEPITVREGGEIRQMSKLEAVLKKTLTQALSGDKKAAFAIIGMAQKEGFLTPEQEQVVENLSESDAAIMEDLKRRLGSPQSEQTNNATLSPSLSSVSDAPQAARRPAATALPNSKLPMITRPLPGDPPD
jgi:hypothetical protein